MFNFLHKLFNTRTHRYNEYKKDRDIEFELNMKLKALEYEKRQKEFDKERKLSGTIED